MSSGRIVTCCAMELAARSVARALGARVGMSLPGDLKVHVVGIGARHLPSLDASATAILSVGLAGALDPSLRRGDVIVEDASQLLQLDRRPRCRAGRVSHADRIISTPEEKCELFRTSGGASVVDMETAVLRRTAEQAGLRFAAIRSVCDEAGEVLHPALRGLVDERGRASVGTAVARLVRSPSLLWEMLRARGWSREAMESLELALPGLLGYS
jgi:adenosylhomocysteine nucleosidase